MLLKRDLHMVLPQPSPIYTPVMQCFKSYVPKHYSVFAGDENAIIQNCECYPEASLVCLVDL